MHLQIIVGSIHEISAKAPTTLGDDNRSPQNSRIERQVNGIFPITVPALQQHTCNDKAVGITSDGEVSPPPDVRCPSRLHQSPDAPAPSPLCRRQRTRPSRESRVRLM